MSDFTFLTKEQVYGDNKIDVIEIEGAKAKATDFAILQGVTTIENNNNIEKRVGYYFTKSQSENGSVIGVNSRGNIYTSIITSRTIGARVALPFERLDRIKTNNNKSIQRNNNGILQMEYGYYPQQAASKNEQEKLTRLFENGNLKKSKNSYNINFEDAKKGEKNYQEYEFLGKKYIRVKANLASSLDGNIVLSNGENCQDGEMVWIEIQPIKWLIDGKSRIMFTEKIIFAGVPFQLENGKYDGNFESTTIKKFINENFDKDIIQVIEEREELKQRSKNFQKLKYNEVSEQEIIKSAIESNVSVFLHGKPGCGKSDRVKQLDPDFIELNLSHLDPELLDGLAGEKDGKAVHIKPPWLEELEEKCGEEPDKIHILFLEELTNASQMMQSKAYGIALDKKVAGRWNLPENARVVAAGNELEDSLVANEIAEPLYDRFAHVNIETTVESWLEWAVTPENTYERLDYKKDKKTRLQIHPMIYSYIKDKGDEALRTPYNREHPEPHADPRRWKMASDMLYASNNPNTLRAIIGEELTRDFTKFCIEKEEEKEL